MLLINNHLRQTKKSKNDRESAFRSDVFVEASEVKRAKRVLKRFSSVSVLWEP